MRDKINLMFKDKLFLVMLVLGLLTIVAAAGVITMRKGDGQEQNPYVEMQGQENFLADKPEQETQANVAGESNARPAEPEKTEEHVAEKPANVDTVVQEETYEIAAGNQQDSQQAQAVGTGIDAAKALVLDFAETSRMGWPVMGNVVLDYSMDSTIYFPTLDQYKCNPGLVIQGEVSSPVYAPANAKVTEVGVNEEIGNYLALDLGNEYKAVCGQLKEVSAVEGEYLEKGQLMGYVAEPTKYYTVEGSNVYFQLSYQGQVLDPLDYLE
ncbi:MAG: peptidoglycan DD-metalloendopeptidase family protein [Lachnospiraceae bacterium]|nr:peptidoglycan DD-metalloendopeptidase family protein [Lachnospiraceae bacterium]